VTVGVVPSETDKFHMLGATHERLDEHVVRRITIAPERARMLGRALRARGVPCVVLATCRRLEVYWDGSCAQGAVVLDVVTRETGVAVRDVSERRHGDEALLYVMAVASGARSMRLGEPEILGQLRSACQVAQADHTSSPLLDRHLQAAIAAARHVRRRVEVEPSQTIGEATVGLMTLALQSGDVRADADDRLRVLLIGAGAVGRSVAKAVAMAAVRGTGGLPETLSLAVTNRTEANAVRLAESARASVVPWVSWPEHLAAADVVICSARTSRALVTVGYAARVDHARREQALWIDLGSPPNIAADVSSPRICQRTERDLRGASHDLVWRSAFDGALAEELRRFRASLERRQSWRSDTRNHLTEPNAHGRTTATAGATTSCATRA